jgi:Xaa-Pro aminopeptidase
MKLPASRQEKLLAVERLRAEMRREGLGALVALSPENVAYAIGYMVPSHPTNRARRTITVLTSDGRAVLIVVSVEEALAREQSRITDVRAYHQFRDHPMDVLADVLCELGVASSPIGMELDYLPTLDYLHLRERLPALDLRPNRELYLRARLVKGPDEIAHLRRIAHISDLAEATAWRELRDGMTEKRLAAIITAALLAEGGDGLRLLVGAGERSGIVNPKPSDRVIREGDVVRVEVLGNLANYQSNVTRTGVVGRPTVEQREIWTVLMDARRAALEGLRPGAVARELWRAYAEVCRRGSIEPTLAFLGHGIGLTGHEEPYITADKDLVLEPGVVLTYEPFYMIPGRMGFHIEDMFLVTDDGYENLTTVTTNEELIEVAGR